MEERQQNKQNLPNSIEVTSLYYLYIQKKILRLDNSY